MNKHSLGVCLTRLSLRFFCLYMRICGELLLFFLPFSKDYSTSSYSNRDAEWKERREPFKWRHNNLWNLQDTQTYK